ncbi:DUF499 domain-containing protein [Sorangium sp. So ce1128]
MRTGELSMAVFAADVHEVALGRGRAVYNDPREFFSLTYPTFALRELARDVCLRLAGKSEKAIRQLELTYGGGKTHTLITLFHLVHDPAALPDLPAVREFTHHVGFTPPRARVAVLPFDKLDVEKGMEVRAPDGAVRWLKHPWSVLAWQLAGAEGLRILHADENDEERDTPPAEPLLVTVLARPQREDLATLVLLDEVLMFLRVKVEMDPAWRGKMGTFFQYLTQAVTKVDRAAIVASILATDPLKSDTLGKELAQETATIFRREREESVQPVGKDDVAEVLRRRFFTPESIANREEFRSRVVAALKGVAELDEQTRKDLKGAEERFVRSYPFHPDLTETLYTKWTQLEGFQRTRGVLRTFALALRDAERWDDSPLVATNIFLGEPGKPGLSEGARELAGVAAAEEYEGKKQEWSAILEGELAKAREIQGEAPALKHREVEQAVFATFLHSQPPTQKALTRDLLVLVGPTKPDKIVLEKALLEWTEKSWFLDEEAVADADVAQRQLPKVWKLGSRPNLRQMHHDACATRVPPDLVEELLLKQIRSTKKLTEGVQAAGAKLHTLPLSPKDLDDDGEFRFAVLGPNAASTVGQPSTEAKRHILEHTGPEKPRVNKNSVVLAVPSRDGLDVARERIREYLGWEEVQSQLKGQGLDAIRRETLATNIENSKKKIPEAITQAYSVLVTISVKAEVQAYKVTPGDEPLFVRIKKTPEARIEETAVNAEALLPDGPYDLWHEGDTARRVKDLVGAFAEMPRLPKMLRRSAILDTLLAGCTSGLFVLRLIRPDRSTKTFWREAPSDTEQKDPTLELVLPEAATLDEIRPDLLVPGLLPELWSGETLRVCDIAAYFGGGKAVKVPREGYEDVFIIPAAGRDAVTRAVGEAVKAGRLWLTVGAASLLGEPVPEDLLSDDAVLQAPPLPIGASDVLPASLPDAWLEEPTTALAILQVLSTTAGKTLPWSIVKAAIDGAIRSRLLETTPESNPWPCDVGGAARVKVRQPVRRPTNPPTWPPPPPPPMPPPVGIRIAEAELKLSEVQNLADHVDEIKTAAGPGFKLAVRIEVGGPPNDEVVAKVNALLAKVSSKLQLR